MELLKAKLFREQDKDHSGQIGWGEFVSMCRKVLKLTGDDASEASLRHVFRQLDKDQSGEISVEELIAFVREGEEDEMLLRLSGRRAPVAVGRPGSI